MPYSKCQLVFVALFLFALLEKGTALKCYTCSSSSSSECNDPFDVQQFTFQKDCEPYEVCIKHRTHETYMAPAELFRGCVTEDYCTYHTHSETEYEYCTSCTWDLCNSSYKAAPSFAIFTAILACNYLL